MYHFSCNGQTGIGFGLSTEKGKELSAQIAPLSYQIANGVFKPLIDSVRGPPNNAKGNTRAALY